MDDRLDKKGLGELLREARRRSDTSQQAIAEAMGRYMAQPPDPSRISRWEHGVEEPMGLALYAYLSVLGLVRSSGVADPEVKEIVRRVDENVIQVRSIVVRLLKMQAALESDPEVPE